jgi:HNH endonuclease
MSLYFFKPVVWNDQSYLRPGGAKFLSGYPAEHGFGHEEWNNNSYLFEFIENGEVFRIFHTEGFGNQPLSDYSGRIFVFMIASHKGKQYLVASAGRATWLGGDEVERRRERLHLIEQLHLDDDRWAETRQLPSVQRAYKNDKNRFLKHWKKELQWLPTWKCPAGCYLGLKTPLALEPMTLTGRQRLIGMYGAFQEIDRHVALRVLDCIPNSEDQRVLATLKSVCGSDALDIPDDLSKIETEIANETTRVALIDARLGQGKFRDDLFELWGGCAVSGCKVSELLRASHVKPWRKCTNKERLDPHNGLLLGAHLDALFDAGLISFDDNGSMLVSVEISGADRDELRLGRRLRKSPPEPLKG